MAIFLVGVDRIPGLVEGSLPPRHREVSALTNDAGSGNWEEDRRGTTCLRERYEHEGPR
jgi:hypothetical protein